MVEDKVKVYTIGHSTRNIEDFVDVLKHYNIELIIDVRRFPSSKKFPHFNKENLEQELTKNKIQYLHYPQLGGFREGGYDAFTKTDEFKTALDKLLEIIDKKNVAIMCAERDFWRCHRKYIAEVLSQLGHQVTHIQDKQKIYEHKAEKQRMNLRIWCDKKR